MFNVVDNNCHMFELISVVISEMGHRSCVVWIWLKSVEQFKDRYLFRSFNRFKDTGNIIF